MNYTGKNDYTHLSGKTNKVQYGVVWPCVCVCVCV